MTLFNILLIIGIVLLVGELVTGTFYFLVIGLSSAIASIFAIYFENPLIPILAMAVLVIIGCVLVHKYAPKSNKKNNMVIQHVGQIAEVIEISKNDLKVFYSGTYWDAILRSRDTIEVGDTVRIIEFSNNKLIVEKV